MYLSNEMSLFEFRIQKIDFTLKTSIHFKQTIYNCFLTIKSLLLLFLKMVKSYYGSNTKTFFIKLKL